MMQSKSVTQWMFSGALVLAGFVSPVSAQWDLWDPWLSGSMSRSSYYQPSFYGGYSAGYVPFAAYYGPAPAYNCGCPSVCDPCGSCGAGGCASGNCSMNAAPAGTPRPIAEPGAKGSYGQDAPVPGRSGTSREKTFEESDPGRFEAPIDGGRSGTNPPKKPFGTGTGTAPLDDFGPRPGETNTTNPERFKANKPELKGPELPEVPEKAPAAPADVKEEEAPKDAALDLDSKLTNRPVLIRDRFVARTRTAAPSVARTPVRPTRDWSAAPVTARVVR